MDARRLLTLTGCALALAGCGTLSDALPGSAYRAELAAKRKPADAPQPALPAPPASAAPRVTPEPAGPPKPVPAPIADPADTSAVPAVATPPPPERPGRARRRAAASREPAGSSTGRLAIAEANAQARAPSRADAFEGGVQMFGYEPGRLYEVWTAPYRVSTLTLAPGETVVSKAAGDTVRWQIGETTSGSGAAQRTHVLLKPLERGLETNLVLTTSERVYMLLLRSGADDAFNAAVAWRYPDAAPPLVLTPEPAQAAQDGPLALGRMDARYRIEPKTGITGRRPRWTPTSVFNDGRRTFIAFAPELDAGEAPVLYVLAPDGESQVVNYRQQGGLFIVDRLFDRAELRLGSKRPEVVRISRAPQRRASR
jgi:type IV secretion system protein VirB9